MCRRHNDFQDFEFCPEAKFYTRVCCGDRVSGPAVVKPRAKMVTAAVLYFMEINFDGEFWYASVQNFVPPS